MDLNKEKKISKTVVLTNAELFMLISALDDYKDSLVVGDEITFTGELQTKLIDLNLKS